MSCADPTKLRFENSTNKKTLKQAWRFFLLYYLFVTQTYKSSNFIEVIEQIYNYSFFKPITVLKPKCSKDVFGSVAILEDTL